MRMKTFQSLAAEVKVGFERDRALRLIASLRSEQRLRQRFVTALDDQLPAPALELARWEDDGGAVPG